MNVAIHAERPDTPNAAALVAELEAQLDPLYPKTSRHGYSVEKLLREGVAFFVTYVDGTAAGCGGIQTFGTEYAEIKRMYVRPAYRGRGLGKLMLEHLTAYARDLGVRRLRLETGVHQHEAIGLYERMGFRRIPPFGTYRDDPLSRYYETTIGGDTMGVILETPRLRLRELVAADLPFVAEMLADPIVMRFYPNTLSLAESEAWLERQRRRYAEDGHGLWLVEDRKTRQPMGQVGLLAQDVEGAREAEVGYLLHKDFWHRGIATEAATGVRDHAFARLGKESVISLIRPVNTPSQAVARRIGMAPEREVDFKGYRHLVFRVLRREHAEERR